MPDFNYYKQGSADAAVDRCYKIVNPKTGEVWDSSLLSMQTAIATTANRFTNLTYSALLQGYPVTLPTALPNGEFDVLFFNGAAAAMTDTSEPEAGYAFKYNKSPRILLPVREFLADRIV